MNDFYQLKKYTKDFLNRHSEQQIEYQVIKKWPEVVGETIASKTQAWLFKSRKLYVRVNNSTWLNELNLQKPNIIDKIKSFLPKLFIEDIVFKFAFFEVKEKREESPLSFRERVEQLEHPDKNQRIAKMTQEISEPELQEIFLNLIKTSEKVKVLEKYIPKTNHPVEINPELARKSSPVVDIFFPKYKLYSAILESVDD